VPNDDALLPKAIELLTLQGKAAAPRPAAQVPERTPPEMLAVLTRIVGRQVERLNAATHGGAVDLAADREQELDQVLERVLKLVRQNRQVAEVDADLSQLTNEQLLALKQQKDR
jgi:hypothetical protein